jgi:hypothetical protein
MDFGANAGGYGCDRDASIGRFVFGATRRDRLKDHHPSQELLLGGFLGGLLRRLLGRLLSGFLCHVLITSFLVDKL